MKILLLCEGDARTHDSWSGVSRSLLTHLEAIGHEVIAGDVDLYGLRRGLAAARTAALSRRRWWVRYHLGEAGFAARSHQAALRIRQAHGTFDVILQVGATFAVPLDVPQPVVMYCDSSIEFARQGAASGHSDAAFLNAEEIREIRAREAAVYVRAAHIVTMSELLRQSFIRDFSLRPERLTTVHCAPNVTVTDPPERFVTSHPPTVLFVGRDFGRKGGDLLTRAFRRVRAELPDAQLRMVGSVPDVPQEPGVEFIPFLSRDTSNGSSAMDRAYRAANVFCLPTRFEPFGTSFLEAMLYGLPCVGPRAWAVPEIIDDGFTGLLVEPENPNALAEALLTLLRNPARAHEMGINGRARALSQFTWDGIASRISDVLSSVTSLRLG